MPLLFPVFRQHFIHAEYIEMTDLLMNSFGKEGVDPILGPARHLFIKLLQGCAAFVMCCWFAKMQI